MTKIWEGYYEVIIQGCIVTCDEWVEPVDEIWCSYVVYPSTDKGACYA